MNWLQRFKRSTAHTQANIICTIVIAAATVAYAFIAAKQLSKMTGQLQEMQASNKSATMAANAAVDTFENTVRPYVEVGTRAQVKTSPDNKTVLNFAATFKNDGTIPAQNVVANWRLFLDGVEIPGQKKLPARPPALPQGESLELLGQIGFGEALDVIKGTKTLTFDVHFSYQWRDKTEIRCERFQYSADTGSFWNLGPICSE